MTLSELNDLDFANMGDWPMPVKIVALVLICALIAGGLYYYDIKDQYTTLSKHEREEVDLRKEFEEKHSKVVNLEAYRKQHPGISILAHPECPPDVLAEADYVGSTNGIINWVTEHRPDRVMMITECSMADNVALETPETEFVRPCNLCPHMKRITLQNIYESLDSLEPRVEIDPAVADKARLAVERMIAI